jgi:hypothetical protein
VPFKCNLRRYSTDRLELLIAAHGAAGAGYAAAAAAIAAAAGVPAAAEALAAALAPFDAIRDKAGLHNLNAADESAWFQSYHCT